MINQWIKIHQTIQVSRDNVKEDWYKSKIQDVDKKHFYIDMPYQNALPLVLRRGDQVQVQIFLAGERIEFKSTVIGKRYDNIPLFTVAMPDNYKRVQLRNFVRLPIMMDAYYAVIAEDSEDIPQFVKTTTLDLSGGGIRIEVDKKYPNGTKLLLKFTLQIKNMNYEVEVAGKVARCYYPDNTNTVLAATEFTNITRRQEDLIVRFIITKMSESLSKK